MIPKEVEISLQKQFGLKAYDFRPAAGGCINSGGTIDTEQGSFFIKWNSAHRFPGMFKKEAAGLDLLAYSATVRVPSVIATEVSGELSYLILENITSRAKEQDFWENAGRALAALHRTSHKSYGLEQDNYIGSLVQENNFMDNWVDFFVKNRLEVQLRLAISKGLMNTDDQKQFDSLYRVLPSLLPVEAPSLLHGDLWGGNLMSDELGQPCFIDPAVYFGNREIELAFTTLFGGFDDGFYDAYNESFPTINGFNERIDLYNLYPLLVHVNLFGGSYVSSVRRNLSRYI